MSAHTNRPDDLTVIACGLCGWNSPELSREEVSALGIPWYCEACGHQARHWVTFQPEERTMAYNELDLRRRKAVP